jgi:hypothetical protein
MEKLHSKSSVSPASGFSFPTVDSENPSLFNEGVPNKPGVKDGFESATKDKSLTGDASDETKAKKKAQKMPLGYDVEIDDQYIPKTGIQDRFLKYRPVFKGNYHEYEEISAPANPELGEIYKRRMEEAANNTNIEKVVYDSMELSPYYSGTSEEDKYFDESKYIHPVTTEQDRKPGAYAPEGYFKFRDQSTTHGLMRYYSDLKTYYKIKDQYDDTLVFESRFESGNLRRVIQTGDYEYDLYLNPDHNTNSFTQWYFFRIQNTRRNRQYTINIKNYQKSDSLYNHGMMPLVYSRKDYEKYKRSWQRDGENIVYYQNPNKKKGSVLNYCMTFNISFKYDNDEVYMSHCYPYTYSDLKSFINKKCNARD